MKTAVAITLINTVVVFGLCSVTLLSGCNHGNRSNDERATREIRAGTTSRGDRSSSPIHANPAADAASGITPPCNGPAGRNGPCDSNTARRPAGR